MTDEELEAFMNVMAKATINVNLFEQLTDAISHALSKTATNDLVLLAGCQGMDYGAGIALNHLYKEHDKGSKQYNKRNKAVYSRK